MWVFSSHQPILQLSRIQFSSDTINSVWSHELTAQSHKSVPISDASHKSQVATHTSDWLGIHLRFPHPLLSFHNLLEPLTVLKGVLYLWLLVYYKGNNLRTAKWKRSVGLRCGEALHACHPPSTLRYLPTWKLSFRVFYGCCYVSKID